MSPQLPHVGQPPGHRGGGGHGRRHQVGAAARPLPALEIAVRRARRSAAPASACPGSCPGTSSSTDRATRSRPRAGCDPAPLAPPAASPGRSPAPPAPARPAATLRPLATAAAARMSSIRPLVQEPMKTTSIGTSASFWPGVNAMYSSMRCICARWPSSATLRRVRHHAGHRHHRARRGAPGHHRRDVVGAQRDRRVVRRPCIARQRPPIRHRLLPGFALRGEFAALDPVERGVVRRDQARRGHRPRSTCWTPSCARPCPARGSCRRCIR